MFREFNPNHYPAGPKGGQFAPAPGHIVGVTSARGKDDAANTRPNRDVAKEMRALASDLSVLPGVSRVSVRPAYGQWNGGSEFSWAVSYDGNGNARRRIAKVGKQWNQDSILFLSKGNGASDSVAEIRLPAVNRSVRDALAPGMAEAGLGGWTWYREKGATVLRAVAVPAWGGDNKSHVKAMRNVYRALQKSGLKPQRMTISKSYKAEVWERDPREGVLSYDQVLGRGI